LRDNSLSAIAILPKRSETIMATSPKFPEDRRPETGSRLHEHPRLQVEKKAGFPWPLITLIVAAVLLVVIIGVVPRAPKKAVAPTAAEVPAQPTGNQLQFSDIQLSPAPVGGAAYLAGRITNIGDKAVTGVLVEATFRDSGGKVLQQVQRPIEGLTQEGQPEDLTKAPIKTNQGRRFRVSFDRLPQGWNRQLPDLRVVTVTAS